MRLPSFPETELAQLLDENRLTLTELAQQEGVNVATCWRWAQRGVRGVKLAIFRVGGRTYTTREAFARWGAATNDDAPVATGRTNRQREADISKASVSSKRPASDHGGVSRGRP